MKTRMLLLTLLFIALLPATAPARPNGCGGGYSRPVMLSPGRGWGYSARPSYNCRPSYNYTRSYARPLYYSSPVFFNSGFYSPWYGNYGYGYGYNNYGYSRPSYGGNPMALPKWTTGSQPLQQTEKVEVEEGQPEVEVPEIK